MLSRQDLERINAQNRQTYLANEAAKAEAAEDRRVKRALAAKVKRAETQLLETSCGHVEQTGNPRANCRCDVCSKRRKAKNARQKAVRKGVDPDAYYEKTTELPDYRLERFSRYGITEDDYLQMLKAQDYKCAICGTKKPGKGNSLYSWAIDHDHSCCPDKTSCGKCVRGLLCQSCNWGLGQFKDSISTLTSAIAYLTKTEDK